MVSAFKILNLPLVSAWSNSENVVRCFRTTTFYEIRRDPTGNQRRRQLACAVEAGAQHAGSGVSHMNHNLRQLQAVHKFHGSFAAAPDPVGNHTAGGALQVFQTFFILVRGRKCRIIHPFNSGVLFQIFRNSQTVAGVSFDTEGKGFQSKIEDECGEWLRGKSHVAHQMNPRFGDVGGIAEVLCVYHAMIAFVRLGRLIPAWQPVVPLSLQLPRWRDRPCTWWWVVTMSARNRGRHRIGVAKVLSTIKNPWAGRCWHTVQYQIPLRPGWLWSSKHQPCVFVNKASISSSVMSRQTHLFPFSSW